MSTHLVATNWIQAYWLVVVVFVVPLIPLLANTQRENIKTTKNRISAGCRAIEDR